MERPLVYIFLLLICVVIICSETEEEKKLKAFKFTHWWDMPGQEKDRQFHANIIDKILKFYETYPWDMDLSGALGVFLLKLNMDNTVRAMDYVQQKYKEGKNDNTCIDKSDFIDVEKIVNRTISLLTIFTDYMLARVARLNLHRKIASGFIFTQETWAQNIQTFGINVHTLTYSRRLSNSWSVPTKDEYLERIYNWTRVVPNVGTTDVCLSQIIDNVIFYYRYPQQCQVKEECVNAILNGDDYGFSLSHRIFMLIYARFARNCYLISEGSDKNLLKKLCSLARLESDYLATIMSFKFDKHKNNDIPDLLIEHMAFCTLMGHRENMRQEWFVQLFAKYSSLNSDDKLCYVRLQYKDKHPRIDVKYTMWKLVRGSIDPAGPCDRHMTGVALAAHAAAYRATVEPIFCAKKKDLCCVPYTLSTLSKYYKFSDPLKLHPLKYMLGNHKFTCYIHDDNGKLWQFADYPKLDELRKEPNSPDIKYGPSDYGFD